MVETVRNGHPWTNTKQVVMYMISASGTSCSEEVVALNGDQHRQAHFISFTIK